MHHTPLEVKVEIEGKPCEKTTSITVQDHEQWNKEGHSIEHHGSANSQTAIVVIDRRVPIYQNNDLAPRDVPPKRGCL